MLPYELLPLPKVGEIVAALDREGKKRGTARVVGIREGRDHTHAISIATKKEMMMSVRNIKRLRDDEKGR